MTTNILGRQLREARDAKGLLVRQVAAVMQIDPSLLSRIERGDKIPTRPQVIQLAGILGIGEQSLMVLYLYERVSKMLRGEPAASEVIVLVAKQMDISTDEINFTSQDT